ncbi:glyoxylate carboligase, partial [Vibrio alfacsensis]
VHIDLPMDVQMTEIEFDIDLYEPMTPNKPKASRNQIERALQMLNDAERPILVAGGGVINAGASPLFQRFAEITGVPVIQTLRGWGAISDDHELMIGRMG